MSELTPVTGCFVTVRGRDGRFRVVGFEDHRGESRLDVENATDRLHVPVAAVGCGFVAGDIVQDVPYSRTRTSMGEGSVLRVRTLGGAEQVLVEFFASSERRWIPFQYMRRIRGPQERLVRGEFEPGLAERFRLRNLAFALEHWNENTGALSHLEVDPLPHQLHLVHHILASGNLNWLIADDVGLGKTVEVGMLLSALVQRKKDRLLVVCPAGLTRQWQEELAEKFHMRDFLIYGHDFNVRDPAHWPLYPRVIASMDMLKHENHLPIIEQSGDWDVVVFDEAHRLSRRQWGLKLDATERYRLAQTLRNLTDNLLLLTATPHQGHHDRFVALLELLRPEWTETFRELQLKPEVLEGCIFRNRKADVTDAAGNFIFHGQTTNAVQIPVGPEEDDFDRALQNYVRRGYQAAEGAGQQGKAIGFVMTTFRKLAASSYAAILASLHRRRSALREQLTEHFEGIEDARFEGEVEEAQARLAPRVPFFEGEISMLDELIGKAARLVLNDKKLDGFMNDVLGQILERNPDEKVLVFSEYRGTQDFIVEALRERFGEAAVVVINGSMDVGQKREAVATFDADAQFLVSTEAGGEGLNLHRDCHVMVNYDLPWNPMRLVQRVGRLYRYGQQHRVMVFNLHAPATLDGRVVESLYERIDSVVDDMCNLSDEFHDRMHAEIFGELASLVDVGDILDEVHVEDHGEDRVAAALERAREAHALQSELLAAAHGFDPREMAGALQLTEGHLKTFVLAMLEHLDCEVRRFTHDGDVVEVFLSETIARRLGRNRSARVALARKYQSLPGVEMMDFGNSLFALLIEEAKRHEFGGTHASILLDGGQCLVSGILRWQDAQGVIMREEYAAALVSSEGEVELNPVNFGAWLAEAQLDGPGECGGRGERIRQLEQGMAALDARLGERSNRYLQPHQCWLFGAAWARAPEET